jgi:hypothetical protein
MTIKIYADNREQKLIIEYPNGEMKEITYEEFLEAFDDELSSEDIKEYLKDIDIRAEEFMKNYVDKTDEIFGFDDE